MITVKFFAILRETLGCDQLTLTDVPSDVSQLRERLAKEGDNWAEALEKYGNLVAVNQTFVDDVHPLKSSDEVAFFPPVTGG